MNIDELPEEKTVSIYLYLNTEYDYTTTFEQERDEPQYVLLAEPVEVTFKIKAEQDVKNTMISKLKETRTKTRADAEIKCKLIDEKIQSLLALPNNSEAA